jgi:hypothetical protein
MNWIRVSKMDSTPPPDLLRSRLYDETSFYEAFSRDLLMEK